MDFPKEIVINKNDLDLMSLKIKNKIMESKMRNKDILSISKSKSNETLDMFSKILHQNIK